MRSAVENSVGSLRAGEQHLLGIRRMALLWMCATLVLSACVPIVEVTYRPASVNGVRVVDVPRDTRGGFVFIGGDERVRVPPGHLPEPGMCRIWYPHRPPGQQPRPGACSELMTRVPADAYLLRRG